MPTDPLERFIQELQDLSTMDGPDIAAALDDLPVPQRGEVGGISMQEAVEVCNLTLYIICYIICNIIYNNGCICLDWILAASKGTRPHSFHEERAHPDGLPKTEEDGSVSFQLAQAHVGPEATVQAHRDGHVPY